MSSWEISLDAGHDVRFRFEPSTKGLRVRLVTPQSAVDAEGEDAGSDDGVFPIACIAATSGNYRLEVTNGGAAELRYRVEVAELRPVEAADGKRAKPMRLNARAAS